MAAGLEGVAVAFGSAARFLVSNFGAFDNPFISLHFRLEVVFDFLEGGGGTPGYNDLTQTLQFCRRLDSFAVGWLVEILKSVVPKGT
jgi:hypothetical protein